VKVNSHPTLSIPRNFTFFSIPTIFILSLAKTLGVLSFTPLTMLQACAQAVDFKVGHHFGEGQWVVFSNPRE
jgi:hypothetical protein